MLCLKNVSYHPAATPQPIIENISLNLESQKLGLIVGKSGSGKTTLLEILSGLANKTTGEIFWQEQELTPEELQQLSGLVFQFPERHFCGSNILEELRLGHPELSAIRVKEALTEVGLSHLSYETPPHMLSGGQQRRLSLAVQLIRQPNILLLDEPTAGLDWAMRDQLVNLLAKLKKHWTLLVVTHDASDLLGIADYFWRIEEGKMKLLEAENIGIIIDARNITQKNYEAVANCAIGYSFSLAAKGKNVYNYAIDENDCWNNESKKTTYEECSKHIKENAEYNIYLVGGEEADAVFYEDNMRVVVPEDNIIECGIR